MKDTTSSNLNYKGDAIIFCQAPADIIYALNIYSLAKSKHSVLLVVINVKSIYIFLKSLKLDARIIYIPYNPINLKNIIALLNERNRIKRIWKEQFNKFKQGEVYFFSRFEDWLTPSFIVRFAKKKGFKVFYTDHYDDMANIYPTKTQGLKEISFRLLLFLLTNAKFQAKIKIILPEFDWQKYHITKHKAVRLKNIDEYSYSMPSTKAPVVLLFVAPCNHHFFDCRKYKLTIIDIIKKMKLLGYFIALKGHPRLGLPEYVKKEGDLEIPSFMPAEFINPVNIDLCMGIETNAICYFAKYSKIPTYSLLNIFESTQINNINIIKDFLNQQSDQKIKFFKNYNDFNTQVFSKNLHFRI